MSFAVSIWQLFFFVCKRKNHFFLLLFLFSFSAINASELPVYGARSNGMGNASVTLSDVWSVNNNQAGLANLKKLSTAIYFENNFLLKETSLNAFALALPYKKGAVGISFSSFGYHLYKENTLGLSYAQKLNKKLLMGIKLNYYSLKLTELYGSKKTVNGEISILYEPLKNLHIGTKVCNFSATSIASYNNERLPTVFRFGAGYHFSEKVLFAIETEKSSIQKALFKAGIEYLPVKEISLRAGINGSTSLFCFGVGLNLNHLTVDLSSSFHPVMGYSPQIGLIYEPGKN